MDIFGGSRKLDAILRQAYRQRDEAEAGPNWQDKVMRRIWEIGPFEPSVGFLPAFGDLVWRLVPVTSLLAAALVCLLLTLGGSADPLPPFVTAAEESMLSQILGI